MSTLIKEYKKPSKPDFSYKGKDYWVHKSWEHIYFDDEEGNSSGGFQVEYHYSICNFKSGGYIRMSSPLYDDENFWKAFDTSGKGIV